MSLVTTSVNGFAGGSPAKPPLPHITDLTSVTAGVDPNLPIRKLLDEASTCLHHAETSRTFGRPDAALREYIRGSLIALEVVPRHKEYVSLRTDRGGLGKLYDALKGKVHDSGSTFERIKAEIKADNARTGVLPKRREAQRNGSTEKDARPPTASPPRTKPIVHPKPQSLHGNAIKHGSSASRSSIDTKDLNARFASLGGPAKQDPRIRTQPIVPPPPPAPRGPRPMPARDSSDIGLDTSLPNMPKMPDAIYSPARGTVSTEAGQLPSSASRGLFTRTGSSSSFSNGLPQSQAPSQSSSSSGPLPPHSRSPPPVPPRSLPPIPPGDYLTAPQLCDLMRTRSAQILLIDVRSRDDFDDGHILAQATICIEPSVLLRDNISAAEIAESNVLAPSQEQQHFERRDKFEVVVLYDQDSESIPPRPTTEAGIALMSLQRALSHFSYGRELQNAPKLLKGGLDAWTDYMGSQALHSTSTADQTPKLSVNTSAPARSAWAARRPSRHVVKPLEPEEVKQWQETLAKEDMDASQSPNFVRSTEDFLRRFPPVAVEQESMTSPDAPASPPLSPTMKLKRERREALPPYNDLPSPPTRPAPAVPRPSYSGLGQRYEATAYAAQPAESETLKLRRPSDAAEKGTHFTGLHNPGAWCYANSTLQVLRMTPGLGTELRRFKQQNNWRVPPSAPGANPSPQLMMHMLANLFQWMHQGCFEAMRASTLMEYSNHLVKGNQYNAQFGGRDQQDASEWLIFLFDELQSETNLRCNVGGHTPQPRQGPALQMALDYWREHSLRSESIRDRYITGVEASMTTCPACKTVSTRMETTSIYNLYFPPGKTAVSLTDLLAFRGEAGTVPKYRCDKCERNLDAPRMTRSARLPEVLIFMLVRYTHDGTTTRKNKTRLTFDVDSQSLEPIFLPSNQRVLPPGAELPSDDAGFGQALDYECYGVVMHIGNSPDQGHYYSYLRDLRGGGDEGVWWKCNDAKVDRKERFDVAGTCRRDAKNGAEPFLLFYRRKR